MTESGLGTVLVWCPAGRFTMGSPKDEAERDKDEDQVEVELSRGFWMGEHEVTQEEWRKVMERNPSYFSAAGEGKAKVAGQSTERFPVEQVSWEEAREFCRKLTEQERRAGRIATGWEYRLPSEAEWEYACRAGTKSATAYGESLSSKEANFDGNFPYNGGGKGVYLARTNEVGKYEGNGWGLKDMHGNVREWCEDEYEEKLRGGRDPVVAGGEKTGNRVIRGGSWDSSGRYCRSANRVRNTPGIRFNFVGFRLVLGPSRQR